MSMDEKLMFLAKFLQEFYILPYNHDELVELLAKIRDGFVLSENEYNWFRYIINGGDNENDSEGDALFTGDYTDLINKPFIPDSLGDLKDYPVIMARINQRFNELVAVDSTLLEKINDNARFIAAIEVVVNDDIARLTKIVEACRLFEGESLDDVINGIKGELGWLDLLKEDLNKGKVLSERDFLAAYEEILISINNTADGLTGYIKNVIADSIMDPGSPTSRLDSIGEALATKVDKIYGKGLSTNDFEDKYKKLLDVILGDAKLDGATDDLTYATCFNDYVKNIVYGYMGELKYMLEDLANKMYERVDNDMEKLTADMIQMREEVLDDLNAVKDQALDSMVFKEKDGPATIAVGGLKAGRELANRNVREVLLEILCPTVFPTVSASFDLTNYKGLYEIGEVIGIKSIIANVTPGSLPVKDVCFEKRAGNNYEIMATYAYKPPTTSVKHLFPDVYEGLAGYRVTQSMAGDFFRVKVRDTAGNESSCNVGALNFVYPIFYGVLNIDEDIASLTQNRITTIFNKVLQSPRTNCTYKYTTNNQRMVIAVPEHHGKMTSVYDENQYIITNSFKSHPVQFKFTVKEFLNGAYVTSTYTQNYNIYYNNPSSVSQFGVTFKF